MHLAMLPDIRERAPDQQQQQKLKKKKKKKFRQALQNNVAGRSNCHAHPGLIFFVPSTL